MGTVPAQARRAEYSVMSTRAFGELRKVKPIAGRLTALHVRPTDVDAEFEQITS
jgi:hypothetical protein